MVFDDVDSWFVEKCATYLAATSQESNLREAMKVKDQFLRGITHQLRTPIHGVLAPCELLTEELYASNSLAGRPDAPEISPSSIINTIRESGKQLMMTVNNILKLNRWSETIAARHRAGLQSVADLEDDILREMKQVVSEDDLSRIPILFENRLDRDGYITIMDPFLLKECIQSLLLNALSNDNDGAVVIVITTPSDDSRLTFDILDIGCGIASADQDRIFEAFEKANPHSHGTGLGLTLAAKIAASMDGSVDLVSSSQDPNTHGSHFRAEFHVPKVTHVNIHQPQPSRLLQYIPRKFSIAHAPNQRLDLVLHLASFLEYQGFKQGGNPEDSFVIIAYTSNTVEFQKLVGSLEAGQRSLCLTPAGAELTRLFDDRVHFFSGPFSSVRLQDILQEVNKAYENEHLKGSILLPEASPGLEIGIQQVSELEISTPRTPPPEPDPVALLVDDNIVNLRILQMYCERRGITYSTAINGMDAVDQFKMSLEGNRSINLVLMDLQMPLCDGIQATQKIRNIEENSKPALVPSRVLMITGQDSPKDKARSFAAGADAFHVKPMGMKALDQGIGEYFPKFAKKITHLKLKPGK
jgi:CheY-like chemotaxis protein